jgi:hypothetical protein
MTAPFSFANETSFAFHFSMKSSVGIRRAPRLSAGLSLLDHAQTGQEFLVIREYALEQPENPIS